MFSEVFKEAWVALGRNRVRSLLTMTGISWGIVAVTLLAELWRRFSQRAALYL